MQIDDYPTKEDKELMWRGFEPRRKDLLPHNVPEKYFLCIAFAIDIP